MSRKGNCWDNAPTESFFNSLKNERVHGTRYRTHREAVADLLSTNSGAWVTVFRNSPSLLLVGRLSTASGCAAIVMSVVGRGRSDFADYPGLDRFVFGVANQTFVEHFLCSLQTCQ